ncbi:hypothetical protein CMO93_02565 [Candidatus Woesearchaeota archaeon]|nr:hypothetical protein [Candidatus Woesearchaeota archaeon]
MAVGVLLASTLMIWAYIIGMKNNNVIGAVSMGIVALTVIVFFIVYITRQLKSVKEGLPVEDERSKKILNISFAKAYLISIYFVLFLSWASDGWIQFRDISQALNMSILGMAIIFGLCWAYYNFKGE